MSELYVYQKARCNNNFFFFFFGLSRTHFFKSFNSHSLVTDGDAAIRHINFIIEKKRRTNYTVS